MPKDYSINIPEYGSYSQSDLQKEYGDNWLKAVEQLNGTFDIPEYGQYSYQEMYDAYGDDIPSALDQLSGKKKEETEVEQEDMESVSEDGSSGLQEWRDEGEKSVREAPATQEDFDIQTTELTEEQIRPQVETRGGDVVAQYKTDVGGTLLDRPIDQIAGILKEENPTVFTTDLERQLAEARSEEIDSLALSNLDSRKKNLVDNYLQDDTFNKESAELAANQDILQGTVEASFASLGLTPEEISEFGKQIKAAVDGRNKIGLLKDQFQKEKDPQKKAEIVSKMKELAESNKKNDEYISSLRERPDRAFADENGNVNQELKADVEKREAGFQKEYKSDYQKILGRLTKEEAKMNSLRESFISGLTPEEYESLGGDDRILPDGQKLGARATFDNMIRKNDSGYLEYFNPELINKGESYLSAYQDADRNFQALSRLALLNEDPAAVSRGWDALTTMITGNVGMPSPLEQKTGELLTSAAESFYESFTGKDYASDRDFRELTVSMAQEEGLDLTPEQIAAGQRTFTEKLGDALGVSADIGIDILATRGMIGGASKMINLPGFLAKYETLRNSPKLVKFMDNLGDVLLEGAAFELASDETDFWMGAAEGTSSKGMDALVSSIAKSKFGKFFKFLDNYAGRFTKEVVGRSTGGVIEEYVGDFASSLSKFGISEEAFKEAFGEGEEAIEKFYLTLGSVGMMTAPTGIVQAAKKRSAEQGDKGSLAKAIEAFEESQSIEPNKESSKKVIEELKKEGSKVTEDLTPEQEKVLTEEEELLEIEKSLTIDETEESTVDTEVTPEAETTTETEVTPEVETEVEIETEAEPTAEGDTFSQKELETPEVESTLKEEQVVVKQEKVNELSKIDSEEKLSESITEDTKEEDILNNVPEEFIPKAFISKINESIRKQQERIKELEDRRGTYDQSNYDAEEIKIGKKRISRLKRQLESKKKKTLESYLKDKKKAERLEVEKKKESDRISKLRDKQKQGFSFKLKKDKSETAKNLENQFGGESYEIESQDGSPLGISVGYSSLTGEPIYSAYKGNKVTKVGVSDYKGDMFTPAELESLKELEFSLKEKDKLDSEKGSPFELNNSTVVATPSVNPKIKNLLERLKSGFGLQGVNIFLTTDSDLNQKVYDDFNLKGSYSKVQSSKLDALDKSTRGSTRRIKEGEHYIYISEDLTPEQQLVVLSHEFGHILEKEVFNKLTESEKSEIKEEYNKWYASLTGKSLQEVRSEVKDVAIQDMVGGDKPFDPSKRFDKYISSFNEWFADNVAKYVSSSEKPKNALEKFFKEIYEGLKKIYKSFKKENKKFPKFEEWLDSVFDVEKANEVVEELITIKKEDVSEEASLSKSGFKKGKKDTTIKKENQAEFKKDIDAVISKLGEPQRKMARSLLVGVKDAKTLAEARTKLDNLVKYGAANPSAGTVSKGTSEKTYQVISDKKLEAALEKAEKVGAKNLSKAQKEIVFVFRDKIKKLGNQPARVISGITSRLLNLKPGKTEDILEFNDYLDKVKKDSDYKAKREAVGKLQSRLANKIKSVGKKIKTGTRFEKAKQLSKINLNRLSSLDGVEEVFEEVIKSISGKEASFENISQDLDMILNEAAMNQRKFMEAKEELDNKVLAEEYNESDIKDKVSFEEYKAKRAEALANQKADERLELKAEEDFTFREWLKQRVDTLAKRKSEITSGMTKKQKAIIDAIIRNKDLINRKDLMGADSVLKLSNAIDEILAYESTSGTTQAAAALEGLKEAVRLKRELNNGLDITSTYARSKRDLPGWQRTAKSFTKFSSFRRAITKGQKSAEKLASATMNYDINSNKTDRQHDTFNKRLKRLAAKNKIKESNSIKTGIISWLRQNQLGLTPEQITQDLKDKVESLTNQVKRLENSNNKTDQSVGKKYRKALDSLGDLSKLDSKENLLDLLDANEQNYLLELEQEFASILSDMQETYRNSNGQELELIENYMPTFVSQQKNKSTKDLEERDSYKTTLDSESSGRTIKRKKVDTTGSTIYNFDLTSTASEGYYQSMYDINTLYDRQVLNDVVKSVPFKDLMAGKEGQHHSLYDNFVEALANVMTQRRNGTALNKLEEKKSRRILNKIYKPIIGLPLKTWDQIIKQPISIIVNTMMRAGLRNSIQGFRYSTGKANTSDSLVGKVAATVGDAIRYAVGTKGDIEFIDKIVEQSSVPIRDTQGDLNIKESEGLAENLMSKTKASRIVSKYTNGMLGLADAAANRGSWISFYMQIRKEQKGKGYKFDPKKDSENLNDPKIKEAIAAANQRSASVNNESDRKYNANIYKYEKAPTSLKDVLFLFKSFSINQTINTYIDIKKLKTDRANAIKALSGTFLSIMAFNMSKDFIIEQLYQEMLEGVTDYEDPDEDDFNESVGKIVEDAFIISLVETFMGGAPDDIINAVLETVNWIGELAGAEEDFVKVYKRPSGVFGLIEGYTKGLAKDIEILMDDSDDEIFSNDMKNMAIMDLLGLLTQFGSAKRFGEFGKRELKKQEK